MAYLRWLILFLCWPVMAAELSQPTNVADLFKSAIEHGGYKEACEVREGGCPMPAVVIALIEDDNIAGQFTWQHPTLVKINSQAHVPGTLEWNATVVHEFVHYLQWLTGKLGPDVTCEQVVEAEVQAYKAGGAYLKTFGIVKDYSSQMFMLSMMCLPAY